MRARILLAQAVLLAFSAGCAGAPAHGGDRIDGAFRAIQRSEARIEAAGREVDRVSASTPPDAGACVERCTALTEAIDDARAGSAGVCETAATLDDHDARTRCERGRSRSAAIEQRASELRARCGCGPSGAS